MALSWPAKSPNEVLDYTLNWASVLGSDTISTSTWALSSADITQTTASKTSNTSTIWISGGTANTSYDITNTIVTVGGRTFVQVVTLPVSS